MRRSLTSLAAGVVGMALLGARAAPPGEVAPMPPVWQNTPIPADRARLEVLLPEGGELWFEGKRVDRQPLDVGPLAPDKVEERTLEIRRPGGRGFDRKLLLTAGWHVRVPALAPPLAKRADTPAAPDEVVLQKGHTGGACAVAFSADGRWILTGGTDAQAILWDAQTGRQLRALPGSKELHGHAFVPANLPTQKDPLQFAIVGVGFQDDDRQLVMANTLGGISRADRETGKPVGPRFALPAPKNAKPPFDVRYHHAGQGAVAFSATGAYAVWHLDKFLLVGPTAAPPERGRPPLTATLIPEPKPTGGQFLLAQVSGNGKVVLAESFDQWPVWDAGTGDKLCTLPGGTRGRAAALADDGQTAAVVRDNGISLHDLPSGRERGRFLYQGIAREGVPNALRFSPDGQLLAAGLPAGKAVVWDVATGQVLATLPLGGEARPPLTHYFYVPPIALAFSPDGRTLVTGTITTGPVLWDARTGRRIRALGEAGDRAKVESNTSGPQTQLADKVRVNAVTFSPDGRQIAAAVEGWGAVTWNADATGRLRRLPGHKISAVAYNPDGRLFLTAGGGGATVWNARSGEKAAKGPRVLQEQPFHPGPGVVFHPDGGRVYVGTALAGEQRVGINFYPDLVKFSPHNELHFGGRPIAFLPDHRRLLTLVGPKLVLWDTRSGLPVWPKRLKFEAFASNAPPPVVWAALLPGGKEILTDTGLVNAETGDHRGRKDLTRNNQQVTAWAMDPAGRIVLAARPGAVDVMATDGRALRSIPVAGLVTCLAFRGDGRLFAAGGGDGLVRLFDVATGDELAKLYAVAEGREWAVVTGEGLFDGSRAGRETVTFRTGGPAGEVVLLDRFFVFGYRPGLLPALLEGQRPLPEGALPASPAPRVQILANQEGTRLVLDVAVTDRGGGARPPVVRHNGAALALTAPGTTEGKTTRYRLPLTLVGGKNRIEVRAATADGLVEGEPAVHETTFDGFLEPPELYVVTVGIDRYDPAWWGGGRNRDLKFAAGDAQAVAEALRRRAAPAFAKVHVPPPLLNEAATHANVLKALAEVARQARPQDAVLVFVACHGETLGQRFFLIPHDVRFPDAAAAPAAPAAAAVTGFGARGAGPLPANAELIRRNGLAVDDLAEPLAKVQALRRVLVFDTCSSGSVVSAAGIFRLAFARLQQAQGVYCLAAAPAGEEAKEPPSLGHGVLTYALLAALGAVDRGPLAQPAGPAPAGVLGWFQFARERVPELYRRPEISGLEQPVEVSGLELPDFPLFGPGPR